MTEANLKSSYKINKNLTWLLKKLICLADGILNQNFSSDTQEMPGRKKGCKKKLKF